MYLFNKLLIHKHNIVDIKDIFKHYMELDGWICFLCEKKILDDNLLLKTYLYLDEIGNNFTEKEYYFVYMNDHYSIVKSMNFIQYMDIIHELIIMRDNYIKK